MNSTLNYRFNNRFSELTFTGATLIAFATANIGILVIYKLIPMLNGSLMAETFPGVAGSPRNIVTLLFAVLFAAITLSYLFIAMLGVNAIRIAKGSEVVKTHTFRAISLIFSGLVTLVFGVVSFAEGESFSENSFAFLSAIGQVSFVAAYLLQVKTVKKESEALPA